MGTENFNEDEIQDLSVETPSEVLCEGEITLGCTHYKITLKKKKKCKHLLDFFSCPGNLSLVPKITKFHSERV